MMLTPCGKREIVTTSAAKVLSRAQLFGGARDGATVDRAVRVGWGILLILDDGTELLVNQDTQIAWLHPAGKAVETS